MPNSDSPCIIEQAETRRCEEPTMVGSHCTALLKGCGVTFHRFSLAASVFAVALLLTAMTDGLPPDCYAQESDRQDLSEDTALRFPQPRITEQQWVVFQAEVMAKPGAEIIERPEAPDLTIIAVPDEYTMVYFTRRGPAHPAVIVAQVVSREGKVLVQHNGYFAGSEQEFSRWLLAVAEQADSLKRSLPDQREQRRP